MSNSLFRFYADNKKNLLGLAVVVIISLFAGILKMLVSALWGQVVDFGIAGEIHHMLTIATLMVGMILVDCFRTMFHYHLIGEVTEGMFVEIRTRTFSKIITGDMAVLEKNFHAGDAATRINNDIESLSTFVAGHVSNFSRLIFEGILAMIGCLILSWQLFIAICIITPFFLWLVKRISMPIQKQSKESMDNTGSAMSIAADTISGIFTVKAFGLENAMAEKFSRDIDAAYKQDMETEKVRMKMAGVKYVASVIQTMVLFLIGSWLVYSGTLTVGMLIAFITMSGYISDFLGQADYMISVYRRAVATAQGFYEILDIPDEKSGIVVEAVSKTPCNTSELAFAYSQERPSLRGISLGIKQGQKVAVVGTSGCGKSTLIKLICRFYLPQSGELTLFGVNIADWQSDALRQNLSIVTQESTLFDGSIYENIAYGRPGATRIECENVLRQVGLWDFVSQYPDGIDHQIGEYGNKLSGGQKQRFCIARAMIKQASFVLLDEATSALDTQTEKEVQNALDKLLDSRSALIVAHRLTVVQSADYIYYMDNGEVVEEGTPAALISKHGRYYDMCRLQGLIKEMEATV